MAVRLLRFSLDHKGIVTLTVLAGLLLNLLVIGVADPADNSFDGALPNAASCQGGGGPGCAEQPLIPPPAVGMPNFDAPPPPVYGALVLVAQETPASLDETPPRIALRPPLSTFAA